MTEKTATPAYPRPGFERPHWQNLNGSWQLSFDAVKEQRAVNWTHEITVPYPPEAELSGIGDEDFHPQVWYRRHFSVPEAWQGQRVFVHFGAVDYRAQVWVNGQLVVTHEGGHTPFSADLTEALRGGDEELVVLAEDDPSDLAKPRGKQDWLREPHSIWYPRTTGIWQTVWLEPVPEVRLERVRFSASLSEFSIRLEAEVSAIPKSAHLKVKLHHGDELLVEDDIKLTDKLVTRTFQLPDPGIDDARAALLWSPESPTLLRVTLELYDGETLLDSVRSYTALREVEVRGQDFLLNGRPYFLRLALDQGYWDESLLAAPDDDALRKDVELAKAMGFNGVRKHQKLEDPRYLYWADQLGLLVWSELPSAYTFSATAAERLTREWLEAIHRDINHPCVVAWVAFNESWGVPDLPVSAQQRDLVAALYHLAKALDGTRPVIGNDGWEHIVTDLLTVHDYSSDPGVLRARYGDASASAQTCATVQPAGRTIVVGDVPHAPVILSEFGGVRYARAGEGWGYDQAESAEDLLNKYQAVIGAASGSGLAGFCYTQFADTFQEQNGLLFSDRTLKIPLADLYKATRQKRS